MRQSGEFGDKKDSEKRRSLRPQSKAPVYVDVGLTYRNGCSPSPCSSPSVSPEGSPSKGRKRYELGEEVIARWNDGLFYLGVILKVDDKNDRCFIRFEDESEYWALYKDITKDQSQLPEEIRCIVCEGEKSDKPNEIVLCDNCGTGYHQDCHKPEIGNEILHPDVTWNCRPCVFAHSAKKGGALKKGPNARAMQELKKSLPYNLKDLKWDAQHKTNDKQTYCYCGGPGDWYLQMLQCARCRQWFHEACMQCLRQPLLFGDKHYVFVCAHCNHGPEFLKRLDIKWDHIVHFALFNLTMINSTKYYDLIDDILPWITSNWTKFLAPYSIESVAKSDWRSKVLDVLLKNNKTFACGKEIKKKTTWWALRVRQPPPIPQITLPKEAPVTDAAVQNAIAKMQLMDHHDSEGLPVLYRNKRKLSETEEPVIGSKFKKRKLNFNNSPRIKDNNNTTNNNNNYKVKSNNVEVIDSTTETPVSEKKVKAKKEKKREKTTLDSIIPWPTSYEGLDHPFKTVLERNQELAHNRLKEHLLNSFSNGCFNGDLDGSDSMTETTDSDCRSLTPIEDLYTVGRLPRRKSSIDPVEMEKKKRGRKSKAEIAMIAAAEEACYTNGKKKNGRLSVHAKNVIDKNTLDGMSKKEIPLNQLRSSVNSYFGAADRLAQGERFKVLARRVTTVGKIQYLVEWEGLVP